ncbi:hypothetical protein M514_24157 [Trichuris suis]|uniref:Uncharacterized protein n=1 Tax=Trichuris suis TaxID=68888 RepID=A0A085N2C9_9BILA|nr:hypothetical protein M514_24157 [Trichuris suis]
MDRFRPMFELVSVKIPIGQNPDSRNPERKHARRDEPKNNISEELLAKLCSQQYLFQFHASVYDRFEPIDEHVYDFICIDTYFHNSQVRFLLFIV